MSGHFLGPVDVSFEAKRFRPRGVPAYQLERFGPVAVGPTLQQGLHENAGASYAIEEVSLARVVDGLSYLPYGGVTVAGRGCFTRGPDIGDRKEEFHLCEVSGHRLQGGCRGTSLTPE